jgi:hypothetical protein
MFGVCPHNVPNVFPKGVPNSNHTLYVGEAKMDTHRNFFILGTWKGSVFFFLFWRGEEGGGGFSLDRPIKIAHCPLLCLAPHQASLLGQSLATDPT